jgi:hypothetical protein
MGSFCGDKPSTQKSTDNVLLLRYFTLSDNPNIGFKATASIGTYLIIQVLID